MIRAKAYTDCRQCQVDLDVTQWAENAPEESLLELAQCGCSGGYASDNVLIYMADEAKNLEARKIFAFIEYILPKQPFSGDPNGYECSVNIQDFKKWIANNKEQLAKKGINSESILQELANWTDDELN